MGGLSNSGGSAGGPTRLGALQVQQSTYGLGVPIVYGAQRIPINLLWYGNFQSHEQDQSGKGGSTPTSYTYSASVAMALCEGAITGIGDVWVDTTHYTLESNSGSILTETDEPQIVPSGLVVTVNEPPPHWYNPVSVRAVIAGVMTVMTDVSPASPAAINQYKRPAAGQYTFHASMSGQQVLITYTYTNGASSKSALAQAGFTLASGTVPQSPWGYLATYYPTQALCYPGLAYMANTLVWLSTSASLPNYTCEVFGQYQFDAGTIPDCDPSVVVADLLTNLAYGAGYPSGRIGDMTSFSQYCIAAGFFLSPVISEQRQAQDYIKEIVETCNSEAVFSEGLLKIIPRGDATITGNGVTWVPNLTPVYDLNDDDFIADADPVTFTRSNPADAFNQVQIEFCDRVNQYNVEVMPATDQANIELYGLRAQDPETRHMIADPNVASLVAQARLQRILYIRNTYQFRLAWQHCLLEPMDVVTLTDSGLGLNRTPVRIIEIDENVDGLLDVTAEELPIGVASPALYSRQGPNGYTSGSALAPGPANEPLIFEPPLAYSKGAAQILVAASGGANWGGAHVWVSFDGNTYKQVGAINSPSRYGSLASALPAPSAQPDVTNTVVVTLNTNAQLLAGSQADVQNLATACYVDGEVLAYRDSTLSGTHQYTLAYLERGVFGSSAGSHSSGAPFARLDDNLFVYPYAENLLGTLIYLKFTSFNLYGQQEESLADVSSYSYLIGGGQPSGPTNLQLQSPFTGTNFTLTWSAAAGATSYDVQVWEGGSKIREVSVTSTSFTYSLEGAISDGGPWRTFTVYVATVAGMQTSAQTQIAVSNPEPAALTGVSSSASGTSISVYWPACSDVDLYDYQVWLSTISGFTPGPGSLVWTGTALSATISGLTAATTYYLVVAARDQWGAGALNYSAQVTQATP